MNQGGIHESKTQSALKGGMDKDGVENKSGSINLIKWLSDHWRFRSNFFLILRPIKLLNFL